MIKSFQGIRVIAMFGIFFFHTGLLLQGSFPVTLFFILSGFVLYFSKSENINNKTIQDHLGWVKNKVKSFYFLHIVTFILSIPINFEYNFVQKNIFDVFFNAVTNLLLIHSFFPKATYSFYGGSWFISILCILYLLSHWLIKIISKLKYNLTIMTGILIIIIQSILTIYVAFGDNLYLYSNPLYRIWDFILGMVIAKVYMLKSKGQASKDRSIEEISIVLIIMVIYIISLILIRNSIIKIVGPAFYTWIFSIALFVFAFEEGCVSKTILCSTLLQNLSKISLEFYMVHGLVVDFFKIVFNDLNYHWILKSIIISIPSLMISLILSLLCFKIKQLNKKVCFNKSY